MIFEIHPLRRMKQNVRQRFSKALTGIFPLYAVCLDKRRVELVLSTHRLRSNTAVFLRNFNGVLQKRRGGKREELQCNKNLVLEMKPLRFA